MSSGGARRLAAAALAAVLCLVAPPARAAASPRELLVRTEKMARMVPPVCAEATVETRRGGKVLRDRAIVLGRGGTLYVAFRTAEVRVLLRAHGKAVLAAAPGPPHTAAPGQPLGGTALTAEDLTPFAAGRLVFPQIISTSASEVMIGGAPAVASQYAFIVYALDPARSVPKRVQGYIGVVNNLGRMLWMQGYTKVAGHWRPTEIRVSDFHAGAQTTMRLCWHAPARVPRPLLRPRGLRESPPAACPAP